MIDITCALLLAIPTIVLLVVVLIMPYFFAKQQQKAIEAINANQDMIRAQLESDRKLEKDRKLLGLCLQAYERAALFLERINPVNIIPRIIQPGQTVNMLETLLVNSIREEYEHNMTQQLYISDKAWELVKMAKEDILKLISTSASNLNKNAPGSELAKEILTKGFEKEINSVNNALINLKKEMQKNF